MKYKAKPAVAGAKVNAPRLAPKDVAWFRKGSDAFSPEYIELSRDLGVCYDLVKLAGHVLKRPVFLKVGGESDGITHAATDGKNIYLPKLHPQRRIALKHEVSHLYFKSNIPLRLIFVEDMISRIEKESGRNLDQSTRSKLTEDLCFVINVFDDLRVNSLWGLLYPGDGRDMEEWYQGDVGPRMMQKAAEDYPNGDISHLMTYIILISLGQPAQSTEWGEFKSDIEIAAGNVCFKTFNAALLLVRDLVLKILRKAVQKEDQQKAQNPTDRPDNDPALQNAQQATGGGDQVPESDLDQLMKDRLGKKQDLIDALTKVTQAPRPNPEFADDNAGFDFKFSGQGTLPKQEDIDALDKLLDQDLDQVLQDLEQDAVDSIGQIQRAIADRESTPGGKSQTEGEWLRKSAKFRLNLHHIKKEELRAADFGREDMEAARKWKMFFQKIMGTLAHRTDENGYELIPDLYIQHKLSGEPLDCFRVDAKGRGFRVNLCVDMSGSMASNFLIVERLSRTLQVALSFPFVKLGVWGFNSRKPGEVDIYKFPKDAPGLVSARSQVNGVTPLSQAIQIVGRDLTTSKDDAHLFVLSDGLPIYRLESGKDMTTKALYNWTHDAVQELKVHKVQTYCFMIGNDVPDRDAMNKMFGRDWKSVSENKMYEDAFELIRGRFLNFLRTR